MLKLMKTQYKYLVVGFAIILFVLPSVVISGRLDDPRMNRDCYKGSLPFYVCVIEGTNTMEKSFLEYPEMHEYYTPQLKETNLSAGQTYTMSGKTLKVGTMTLTGGPSFTYTKR